LVNIRTLSLRSSHTQSERQQVVRAFNDPNTQWQVLATTYRCSAIGLNLQGACSEQVMLDVPSSVPMALQAFGRIHRLGQGRQQTIWIVTTDHTYDQLLQAHIANKMQSQLAGEGDLNEKFGTKDQVDEMIRQLLGQRASREGWTSWNLGDKDQMPSRKRNEASGESNNCSH
jgi:SNF2 family DNA or RNA helicase